MTNLNRRHVLLAGGATLALAGVSGPSAFAQTAPLPPAPTPEQWAKSPSVQNIILSPDGNHIAYMTENGGTKILSDFDLTTQQSKSFNIGNAKVANLFWIDNVHVGVETLTTDKFKKYAGGQDTFSIVTVYNLSAASTTTLFTRMENFEGFVLGDVNVINNKGKIQLTASSRRSDADDSKYLYRFDLDTQRGTVIDRGDVYTLKWVLTPEGELVGRSQYDYRTRVWRLDYFLNGSWKTLYSKTLDQNWPSLRGLGRDGKTLVVYIPLSETDGNYFEMSPDGTLSAPLVETVYEQFPIFDQVTRRLCGFVSYASGWPAYSYFDPARQTLVTKAQAAVEGYRMVISDTADDPRKMIVYSEGDDDAGSYYFIDFGKGQVLQIGASYPDIPTQWITSKKVIKYKAADGLEIEAFLTLPPNKPAKDLALIVHPHGGPEAHDTIAIDTEVQSYASMGYAVLQPNFRGSTGYGDAFTNAGHGEWGRKMQTDLSDGVRHLVSQGLVDPKRVAIVGASYGGYAALAGATLDTGVYNCAIDVAGISDVKAFTFTIAAEENYQPGPRTRYLKRYLGATTDLDAISPIHNIDKVTIPIMIIHGKADTVVEYAQSANMAAALKAKGKAVEFITFKGQDHWETDEASRIEMMGYIAGFLKTHNPA